MAFLISGWLKWILRNRLNHVAIFVSFEYKNGNIMAVIDGLFVICRWHKTLKRAFECNSLSYFFTIF